MKSCLTAVVCVILASGCAHDRPQENAKAEAFDPAGLLGTWDTAAQFAATPADLKRPPTAGAPYPWLDRQHARFAPVSAPGVGASVVYLEWRSGGPNGPVSRQRLWSFRTTADGATVMDFYTLKAPETVSLAAPESFARLTLADLVGYGEACALRVATIAPGRWAAQIDAATCRIVARSGRSMGIEATVVLDGDRLIYSEAGVLDDGAYAFKVPGVDAYVFDRAPR